MVLILYLIPENKKKAEKAWWVKARATKSDGQRVVPETHTGEENTNSYNSDLHHVCAICDMCTHIYTYTH